MDEAERMEIMRRLEIVRALHSCLGGIRNAYIAYKDYDDNLATAFETVMDDLTNEIGTLEARFFPKHLSM